MLLIIVGKTGAGKTSYAKNILSTLKRRSFIYDINNEYKMFYNAPFVPFNEFLANIMPVKNSVILIEEASIFLRHNNVKENLINKICRKRHENNFYILNFHSLRKIPIYIFDFCDYLTLFKTNDAPTFVETKYNEFAGIPELFKMVNENENRHFHKTIKIE